MNKRYERQTKIIADARKAMGYSQQQVATIIGVHVRQYQRIECGERDIRYASMKLGLSWLYHTTAGLTTSGICDDGSEPYLERHTPEGGGEGQTEGGGVAAGSTAGK